MDEEKITLPASKMRARNADFQSNGKRKQAFHFPSIGFVSSVPVTASVKAMPCPCTILHLRYRFSHLHLFLIFLRWISCLQQKGQALQPRSEGARLAWREKLRIYELLFTQEAKDGKHLECIENHGVPKREEGHDG
jgi:hypothetical protein